MYLIEGEIYNQYDALRCTYDYLRDQADAIRDFYASYAPRSITFIGCGSGYCLCRSGAVSASLRLGIPGYGMAAGDLLINFDQYRNMIEGTLLVAPSRSGGTSEVVMAVEKAKALGVKTLGIAAKEGSPLGEIADLCLEIPWAFDESVCQTRTVTNLYTANLMLLGIIAEDDGLLSEINSAITVGNEYMEKYTPLAKEIAAQDWTKAVVLADSELEGIADEAAIAVTEIAQLPGTYHHVLMSGTVPWFWWMTVHWSSCSSPRRRSPNKGDWLRIFGDGVLRW